VLSSAVSIGFEVRRNGVFASINIARRGQFCDEIRTQASILGLPILLLDEVAVSSMRPSRPPRLSSTSAVAAADGGLSQRLDQVAVSGAAPEVCFDNL